MSTGVSGKLSWGDVYAKKYMGFLSVNLIFSHSCLLSQENTPLLWLKKLLESTVVRVVFSPMTNEKKSLFEEKPKSTIVIIDFSPLAPGL